MAKNLASKTANLQYEAYSSVYLLNLELTVYLAAVQNSSTDQGQVIPSVWIWSSSPTSWSSII